MTREHVQRTVEQFLSAVPSRIATHMGAIKSVNHVIATNSDGISYVDASIHESAGQSSVSIIVMPETVGHLINLRMACKYKPAGFHAEGTGVYELVYRLSNISLVEFDNDTFEPFVYSICSAITKLNSKLNKG